MCGDVVDCVVNTVVPVPAMESGDSLLHAKIETARRCGLLPDEVDDRAHKVRLRGNVAVHSGPETVDHVKETVMMRYSVLEAVYG